MTDAEQAWEAHYARIYPRGVFSDLYMKSDGRPAFIAAKKAGFLCGWEEATEALEAELEFRDQRIKGAADDADILLAGRSGNIILGHPRPPR